MSEQATAYAREIRAYLLGRLDARHDDAPVTGAVAREWPLRWQDWWIFEGKRYAGFDESLARSWAVVAKHLERMHSVHSPRQQVVPSPEGEIDWLESGALSLTSGVRQYVARASGLGLVAEERAALDGWAGWISRRWGEYVRDLGQPAGVAAELPVPLRSKPGSTSPDTLRRWAHIARRSRWPLLRNVVAETVRAVIELEEIDRLPLPTDLPTLFELACVVRVFRALHPSAKRIRWFDSSDGNNTVVLPVLTCWFQRAVSSEQFVASEAVGAAMRRALGRHGVTATGQIDAWFHFAKPMNGFVGLLLECKSGAQGPRAALEQMHAYRESIRAEFPGPVLVLGVIEAEGPAQSGLPALQDETRIPVREDVCAFCTLASLVPVLEAVGIATPDLASPPPGHPLRFAAAAAAFASV